MKKWMLETPIRDSLSCVGRTQRDLDALYGALLRRMHELRQQEEDQSLRAVNSPQSSTQRNEEEKEEEWFTEPQNDPEETLDSDVPMLFSTWNPGPSKLKRDLFSQLTANDISCVCLSLAPCGRLLASSYSSHSILIHDTSNFRAMPLELTFHARTPWSLAFHPCPLRLFPLSFEQFQHTNTSLSSIQLLASMDLAGTLKLTIVAQCSSPSFASTQQLCRSLQMMAPQILWHPADGGWIWADFVPFPFVPALAFPTGTENTREYGRSQMPLPMLTWMPHPYSSLLFMSYGYNVGCYSATFHSVQESASSTKTMRCLRSPAPVKSMAVQPDVDSCMLAVSMKQDVGQPNDGQTMCILLQSVFFPNANHAPQSSPPSSASASSDAQSNNSLFMQDPDFSPCTIHVYGVQYAAQSVVLLFSVPFCNVLSSRSVAFRDYKLSCVRWSKNVLLSRWAVDEIEEPSRKRVKRTVSESQYFALQEFDLSRLRDRALWTPSFLSKCCANETMLLQTMLKNEQYLTRYDVDVLSSIEYDHTASLLLCGGAASFYGKLAYRSRPLFSIWRDDAWVCYDADGTSSEVCNAVCWLPGGAIACASVSGGLKVWNV
jgi:hypothetical protein